MKVCSGATRVVLVTKNRAYKIARIRILWVVRRFLRAILDKSSLARAKKRYLHRKAFTFAYAFFPGIFANRAEYAVWKKFGSRHYNPVSHRYLWGFIIVQPRAEPVTEFEIMESPLRKLFSLGGELGVVCQYGRVDDRIVIIDYAHLGLFKSLLA